jgi:hypothetical protein
MTDVASAPAETRDRWRHALNAAAERLSVVRESLGVLGAMPGKGSLEGLAEDLSRASFTLAMIRTEVYGVVNRARREELARAGAAAVLDDDLEGEQE